MKLKKMCVALALKQSEVPPMSNALPSFMLRCSRERVATPRPRLARAKQKAAARKRKKAAADPAASASFQEFDRWQNEAPIADDA